MDKGQKRKYFKIPHPSPDLISGTDGNQEFVVIYTINVRAKNCKEAAIEGENIMNHGLMRPCLHVLSTDTVEFFNLEDDEFK